MKFTVWCDQGADWDVRADTAAEAARVFYEKHLTRLKAGQGVTVSVRYPGTPGTDNDIDNLPVETFNLYIGLVVERA